MERQSALHRCHLRAQGQLKTFSGWQLPAWYTDPSRELEEVRAAVGISDVSDLSKFDIRGPAGEFPPPAQLWKLTPSHALVISPQPIGLTASAAVTDVTSIYSAILLAGTSGSVGCRGKVTADPSAALGACDFFDWLVVRGRKASNSICERASPGSFDCAP